MTFTRTTNTLKSGTGRRRLSTHVATEFVARVVHPARLPSPLCIPCTVTRLGAFGLTLRPAIFERPGHPKGSGPLPQRRPAAVAPYLHTSTRT
jgi:hypothetical protein